MFFITRNKLALSILIIITVISAFIKLYPTNLNEIYGSHSLEHYTKMKIGHSNSINEPTTYKTIYDFKNINGALDYLSSFKLGEIENFSFKKYASLESYQIMITNDKKEIFSAAIRGNKYIFFNFPNGDIKCYKILNDTFDMDYFDSLYNTGSM